MMILKSLKKKDLLWDGDELIICTRNLAKLNVIEYTYCKLKYWDGMVRRDDVIVALDQIWGGMEALAYFLVIPFIPIWYPIAVAIYLRKQRDEVKRNDSKEKHS